MSGSNDKKRDISLALAAAAGALLSNSAQAGLLDYDLGGDDWDAQAAFLLYSESDGRVSAVEPAVQLTRNIDTDETLTLRLTLDSLTGASPSGAVPSNNPQTFTSPSGNGSYSIGSGGTPLDDTFKDSRVALNAAWTRPVGEDYTLTLGANASREYDYFSLGFNSSLARDFNQKNTTLSAGLAFANDTISPVGGAPVAFAQMLDKDADSAGVKRGDEDKSITDLLFGLTQVIDRDSVMQLSLGFSQSDGYLNDPYKIISVLDANGDPVLANAATNLSQAVFENRPDSRTRQSIYAQYKRNFEGSVFNTSYRYMQDDWEVKSHTLDLSYRMPIGAAWWQPRLRFYSQQEAEFYTPFYRDGEQPVAGSSEKFATADYRLGNMDATTVGLSYGRDGSRPWQVTLEYYLQSPEQPDNTFGALQDLSLAAELDALIVRFNIDL